LVLGALFLKKGTVMKILHNNLARLKNDAKALRKHLNRTISAQESLDIIARVFGWDSWNDLFVHSQHPLLQRNTQNWQGMRLTEKIMAIQDRAPRAAGKGNKDLADWLFGRIAPQLDKISLAAHPKSIDKWLPILYSNVFNNASRSYKDFSYGRMRDGVSLASNDTHLVMEHIYGRLLPELDYPGCVTYCDPFAALDLVRTFKRAGYRVKLFGFGEDARHSHELSTLDIHSMNDILPTFSSKEDETYGVYKYLMQTVDLQEHKYNTHLVRILIGLIVLRINMEDTPIFEILRKIGEVTLDSCIELSKGDKDAPSTTLAQQALWRIEVKDEQEPLPIHYERFQYAMMQLTQQLNYLRKKYYQYSEHPSTIEVTDRPLEKEVYIIAHSQTCNVTNIHNIIMHSMLLDRFKKSAPQAGDHTLLLVPNLDGRHNETLTINTHRKFKFSEHNEAEMATIYYGDEYTASKVVKETFVGTELIINKDGCSLFDWHPVLTGLRSEGTPIRF
jgi:hypothetical protein